MLYASCDLFLSFSEIFVKIVGYENIFREKFLVFTDDVSLELKYQLRKHLLRVIIHYSFAPIILFGVPYTLDLLPYYLSIANGAGGIGIFELLVFQCFV